MLRLNLSPILKARNVTRYWLAKRTGLPQQTIYGLEERGGIEYATLSLLVEALDCTPNDILLPEGRARKEKS